MDAPQGAVVSYCLPPGTVKCPDGWEYLNFQEGLVYPTGDEDEGVNPYQPDCSRIVMLVKL